MEHAVIQTSTLQQLVDWRFKTEKKKKTQYRNNSTTEHCNEMFWKNWKNKTSASLENLKKN